MQDRTISGLIFDLDGVLIHSREAHRQAFEEVLAPFGIEGFDYDRFVGRRTLDVFEEFLAGYLEAFRSEKRAEIVTQCAERKTARAQELLKRGNAIPEDSISVLKVLATDYALALASSGSRSSVATFLDRTGLDTVFRSVLSGDDVDRAKPDPELFSRSIATLGLLPAHCLVIEDAVAGVQAGRAAGARVIGFGDNNGASLLAAGAERVVGSLQELVIALDAYE